MTEPYRYRFKVKIQNGHEWGVYYFIESVAAKREDAREQIRWLLERKHPASKIKYIRGTREGLYESQLFNQNG